MAERPDLEYAVPILAAALRGRAIVEVRVPKPVVLRVAVEGQFERLLVGRTVGAVTRRGHFVRFELTGNLQGSLRSPAEVGDLEIVVAPMLAGRFRIDEVAAKSPADLAVAWRLDDGRELRYRDDVQMGKVYLLAAGDWRPVPGLSDIGVDVLDGKKFTRAKFREIARRRRDQAKVFLMDKSALDALGNAYADEALFSAGVHPKSMVRSLDDATLDQLHDGIADVLARASAEIARRKPPLDEKLRDFLSVRGRHGDPCPRCGAKIRKAGVHGHDAFFCPHCQPETRKSAIVDWRKTGK